MKKHIVTLIAALGLMSLTKGVNAADIYGSAKDSPRDVRPVSAAPAPVAPIKWTGLHIGVGLGYGAAKNDISVDFGDTQVLSLDGLGGMGAVYDAEVGYDVRIPSVNFVVGIVGGYGGSEIETEASLLGLNASYKHGTSWWVGGRAGPLLADDRVLLYGKLVYVENSPEDIEYTGGSFSLDDRQGLGYGGGLEGAVGGGLFAGIEAMYYDFDENTVYSSRGVQVKEDTDVLDIKFRLRYKIGAGAGENDGLLF